MTLKNAFFMIFLNLIIIIFLIIPASAQSAEKEIYNQLNFFGDVLERIRSYYVEKPEDSVLIHEAINGMLQSLDPHSSYMPPKAFEKMQEHMKGQFGGLGIEVTMENGLVKIVTPIDSTPAAKAGLQSGDLISHLDGKAILGITLSEAVKKMRGPIKSKIILTIIRKGQENPLEVSVIRDVIRVQSVRSHVVGNIIYIRITSFTRQTHSGLKNAISKRKAELKGTPRGIILDLRNNPGGALDQAIAVSDSFLDKGEIVSTRGRRQEDTHRYNAQLGDLADGLLIIVLINGGSASASEIVAGALQDHKRAIIIGTKSFGKGSVQSIIPIKRHGAIRLTTARYYTPSGKSIQAKGIIPDILVKQIKVTEKARINHQRSEADLPKHLKAQNQTSGKIKHLHKGDDKGFEKPGDFQLNYALDLLRGMTLLQR